MRIYKGSLLSPEEAFNGGSFLIGSGGNVELKRFYLRDLYDRWWVKDIYIESKDFNKTTLVIGKMGSGKSNLLKYIVASFPENRFIIHDIKGEYTAHFYQEGDVIVNHLDKRGIVWDVLKDCRKDKMLARSVFYNMVASYNKGKDAEFWTLKAVEWLMKLLEYVPELKPKETALAIYEWYKKQKELSLNSTEASGLATALPTVQTLLDLYSLAYLSDKPLLTLDEILARRKVFLVFLPEFARPLSIVNQGFLSASFNRYLSRPDTKDFKDYTFFILDEYLNFNIDPDLEKQVLTLARSKGMCLFLGMQFLPVDSKDRLSLLMNSRHFLFAFRVDAVETAKVLAESSGNLEYGVEDISMQESDFSLTNIMGGLSGQVQHTRVQTYTVPPEVFLDLRDYIAYAEITTSSGKLKTFIKPVWYDLPEITGGFERDENSYHLKSL